MIHPKGLRNLEHRIANQPRSQSTNLTHCFHNAWGELRGSVSFFCFSSVLLLSRTRLDDKVRYLLAAVSISPLQTFSYFVEWLVVAQLLENVPGVERARRLFPLLLLVLPAKLLVAGRIVTWSELAGAVLACICWYFLSGYSKRTTVVGGLIVSLLIVRGLVPYHWSRIANPFSWVPFGGFLRAEWDFGLLTFLQKCFWYGSAVWLLRTAGWRLARAAIALAVLLGAIEVIQIHLPGRVAEITDPALALILAMTLGLLDRSDSVRSNLSSTKVRARDAELP